MASQDRKLTAEQRRAREDEKRQRRVERQAAEQATRQRVARNAMVRRWAVIAGVTAAVVIVVGFLAWPDPEMDGVERPTNQGRQHIATGTPISYDDPAPTSGPHWPAAPRCGVYGQPLELELAVHGVEHGAVIVWHRVGLPDTDVASLWQLIRRWNSHVIVSPNPRISEDVVLTAWDRRLAMDALDLDTVEEFIDVYRQRGPETADCPF